MRMLTHMEPMQSIANLGPTGRLQHRILQTWQAGCWLLAGQDANGNCGANPGPIGRLQHRILQSWQAGSWLLAGQDANSNCGANPGPIGRLQHRILLALLEDCNIGSCCPGRLAGSCCKLAAGGGCIAGLEELKQRMAVVLHARRSGEVGGFLQALRAVRRAGL